MPTWLLIVPLLAFLVFVHELGHFVAAKRFGIKVLEFGFGFPPRLFGVRHGETVYSINAIPLGGFVRLLGEEDPTDERSLARQSVLRRVIVLCAGSFMNFAVAFVIFAALSMLPRDVVIGTVTVTGVAPDSPAAHAGIRAGDQVLAVNGEQVRNPRELIREVTINLGYETELSLRRGSIVTGLPQSMETAAVETVTVVPRLNPPSMEVVEVVTDRRSQVSLREARRYRAELAVGDTLRQGAIGIILGVTNGRVVQERLSPWQSAPHALGRMWEVLVVQKNGIQQMFAGGGGGPALTGPIGIAQVTGEVARSGVRTFMELTALISISLGILNILPIPALDGGRLMFALIEWARRGKRISPRREALVHLAGFGVLIALIVIISYFDVVRILSGESFIR